jgi:putative ABC transport system permease protein
MRYLLRRLWSAIRSRRVNTDLLDELEFHRAMTQREFENQGHTPIDAALATRRALGSVALAQDHMRDAWCPRWLQGFGQDLRLAIRTLASTKVMTAVAVLSLALGVGANTAIFSLINSLLLRTLPVKDAQQLVTLSTPRITTLGGYSAGWPYSIWEQLRRRPDLFEGVAAWNVQRFNLAHGGEAQLVDGFWVSGSFFNTLGVPAVLGRVLTDADDRRGGGGDGAVVMISYAFWQTRFGGAADAIGRTLTIEHVPFTIVGVTPPNFFGMEVGRTFDVAMPIAEEPLVHGRSTWLDRGTFYWLRIVGRLKAGETIGTASAKLRAAQAEIREATLPALPPEIPKPFRDAYLTGREGFELQPAATGVSLLRQQYQRPLVILLIGVGLVLLIACANIANLQLARMAARRREISVRLALGASRWRLGRQVFAESAGLASLGAVLGLVFASWASRFLVRQLSTPTATVFLDLSTDTPVLLFALGLTVATALLFGVAPSVGASRSQPMDILREHDRRVPGGTQVSVSGALVVVQVALSLVLVVAVGLFVRTFTSLASRDLGFKPDRVLLATIDPQHIGVDVAQVRPLYERAADAVRELPDVGDVALSAVTPVQGGGIVNTIAVSGGTAVPSTLSGGIGNAWGNIVSPGWFHTLGITLVAGRDFSSGDSKDTPPVVIVNQALVRAFLNGEDPLGHTITTVPPQGPPMDIVGMVADAVYGSPREAAPPTVFTPLAQLNESAPLRVISLNVRAERGSASGLIKSVAAGISRVNPDLVLTFQPLADQVSASLAQERLVAVLSGCFGALASILAGIGLYGVMSYAVARRQTELGIRMALGASPGVVVRLVLSRAAALVWMGVTIGVVVSVWASRFVAALLYGLEPRDPLTLVGAVFLLTLVAACAAGLPAWRASRIDPAITLRDE